MSKGHILLGATGEFFTRDAFAAGNKLTAFGRYPSKLSKDVSKHPNTTLILGHLTDMDVVQKVTRCGAAFFVSFAGPVLSTKGTPLRVAKKVLYPLLIPNNFTCVLVPSTPSYAAPEDKGIFKWSALIFAVKLISYSGYQGIIGIGTVTAAQPLDKLKWTVFRVPHLTDGPEAMANAALTGSGIDGIHLSRTTMAGWVLKEIDEEKWIGRCPLLCNPSKERPRRSDCAIHFAFPE